LNIALLSSLYAPNLVGGAERVAQDVAEAMAGRGHAVTVISLAASADAPDAELNGVRIRYCGLKNLYWPFPVSRAGFGRKVFWHLIDSYNAAMARRLGGLLDGIRPDVVNTHNLAGFSVAAWGAIKARRLPLVHTLHDHYLLCPYSTMFRNGRNCRSRCFGCRLAGVPRAHMTQRVDGVIGVSRYILQRHLDHGLFPNARATVAYSAIRQPAAAAAAHKEKPRQPLRIGFLGRLEEGKGLLRLIDAFLDLPRNAAELWIAGTGEPGYEAMLRQRTSDRSDVRWLGFVTPDSFLPDVHLLVVPSLWQEAMGRVVLEAFAYGVPVAGADRGGIPELIGQDCGWVFDPDRSEELGSILKLCVEQPLRLEAMRSAATAAARRFSEDAMMAAYLGAYRDATQRPGLPPAS